MTKGLAYLNARLAEPSTLAALGMVLGLLHVKTDPGMLHDYLLLAGIAASLLAAIIPEVGHKPAAAIAEDAARVLIGALNATAAPSPAATPAPGVSPPLTPGVSS